MRRSFNKKMKLCWPNHKLFYLRLGRWETQIGENVSDRPFRSCSDVLKSIRTSATSWYFDAYPPICCLAVDIEAVFHRKVCLERSNQIDGPSTSEENHFTSIYVIRDAFFNSEWSNMKSEVNWPDRFWPVVQRESLFSLVTLNDPMWSFTCLNDNF